MWEDIKEWLIEEWIPTLLFVGMWLAIGITVALLLSMVKGGGQ